MITETEHKGEARELRLGTKGKLINTNFLTKFQLISLVRVDSITHDYLRTKDRKKLVLVAKSLRFQNKELIKFRAF